jgi:hypothetical protein
MSLLETRRGITSCEEPVRHTVTLKSTSCFNGVCHVSMVSVPNSDMSRQKRSVDKRSSGCLAVCLECLILKLNVCVAEREARSP